MLASTHPSDYCTQPFGCVVAIVAALPQIRACVCSEVKDGDFLGPDGFNEMKGCPVRVYPSPIATDKSLQQWYDHFDSALVREIE